MTDVIKTSDKNEYTCRACGTVNQFEPIGKEVFKVDSRNFIRVDETCQGCGKKVSVLEIHGKAERE